MVDPTSTQTTPPRQSVPPVSQPVKPARILLLTDSIHSNTPTHLFENIPNHVCIKKKEYQLANLDKYSDEFAYTDFAVISMGVNDLCRYGHDARSLAAYITPLLQQYSTRYPHCQFVFNTLLLTRDYQWLNKEIESFNQYMYKLSRDVHNLCFFDSDRFTLKCFNESRQKLFVYAVGPTRGGLSEHNMRNEQSNNGIHISLQMRRLVASELVRCVGYLSGADGARFRRCDWVRNANTHSS